MTENTTIEKSGIRNQKVSNSGVIYFIGIGGIGMSALARYYKAQGYQVSGYDKTETVLTRKLTEEGIDIHYTDDIQAIAKDAEMVVYTPAIPATHSELNWYKENGYKVVKRSEVLGEISKSSFNICVAGTHGKTTVSTMIAHLLRYSGYGCNAFLGGISNNYGTNFWSDARNVCVIEADEYDRSFLKLSPDIAIITSMDADHLDIYGDEVTMQEAFIGFGNKVKQGGLLITKFGLQRTKEMNAGHKKTYSLQNDAADVYASGIRIEEGSYHFNVQTVENVLSNIELAAGGMHNVENMVAAIAVTHYLGVDSEKIRAAVLSYKGVKRRFEYIIPPAKKEAGGYVQPVLIDDYAHHPEELRALLNSVKALFKQRAVTVIFQPHLFSRTKDFSAGFAEVLSIADTVILLPIYPAREEAVPGVTSNLILDKIDKDEKYVLDKEEVLTWARQHSFDKEFGEVVVIAGAGDIDTLVEPVKKIIENA